MTLYRVTFKNHEGEDRTVQVDAESGTRAMLLAMELYEELRLHPNRITKVQEETE